MLKNYRYVLYTKQKQNRLINKKIDYYRFVCNYYLNSFIEAYKKLSTRKCSYNNFHSINCRDLSNLKKILYL
jgi:transposase